MHCFVKKFNGDCGSLQRNQKNEPFLVFQTISYYLFQQLSIYVFFLQNCNSHSPQTLDSNCVKIVLFKRQICDIYWNAEKVNNPPQTYSGHFPSSRARVTNRKHTQVRHARTLEFSTSTRLSECSENGVVSFLKKAILLNCFVQWVGEMTRSVFVSYIIRAVVNCLGLH